MANLIISDESLTHLKKRLIERFPGSGINSEDEAEKLVNKVKEIMEKNSPEDWRFTTSPSAKFIIAYGKNFEFRFLGRSYRDLNEKGKEIKRTLSKEFLSSEELQKLAAEYRNILFSPNCQIYHELKTVYSHSQDISEEKMIFERIISTLPHTIPITGKRIALRPNALIVSDELWVRQGEYFDFSKETNKDYEEYLIFQKLTKEGIDKSKISIYTLNKQGHLKYAGEEIREIKKFPQLNKTCYGRSQSYWILPTYIDALYMDLIYTKDHWDGDEKYPLNSKEMLLLARIEKILKIVKESFKIN